MAFVYQWMYDLMYFDLVSVQPAIKSV